MSQAMREVETSKTPLVAMFFWPDIKGWFSADDPLAETLEKRLGEYSREEFEQSPARCGVAYYHQPFKGGQFVFE